MKRITTTACRHISACKPAGFIFTVIFTVLLALLPACTDYLDVAPSDFLTKDQYYHTLTDLHTALNGAYAAFESDDLGGATLTIAPDIMTDNAVFLLLWGDYIEMSNNQLSVGNGIVTQCWLAAYRSVNQLNLILESLDRIEATPAQEAERAGIRGEALFLRGVIYFELVRLFGKPYGPSSATDPGLPLPERATTALSEVTFPPRATVEEVYARAVADLTEARKLLPASTQRGHGNRFAATGYLAKIAFQQRRYTEAAGLAGEVMAGPFALVAEPKLFFTNEGSPEEIWSVVHDRQGNGGGLLAFHVQLRNGPRLRLRAPFVEQEFPRIVTAPQQETLRAADLTAIDLRRTTLVLPLPDGSAYACDKYEDLAGGGDDAPLLRLAELYLMRAEALVRTEGVNPESIDLLNAVRRRALRVVDAQGAPAPGGEAYIQFRAEDFATPDELIEAIILERRIELALEGNYFHDLMRLQRPVKDILYDADRLRWPIPQREMDANGNLVQNPGY